jgi:hypothetical protein
VSLTVLPVNDVPVLGDVGEVRVLYGQLVRVTNSATDVDVPVQGLSYELVEAPAGAQIDGQGVIQWLAGPDRSTNVFTTVVRDDGEPALSATNSFKVVVTWPELRIVSIRLANGVAVVTWDSVVGQHYRLQYKDRLGEAGWKDVPGIVTALGSQATHTQAVGSWVQRYYRVVRVAEGNSAPVLGALSDVTLFEGETLSVTNSATDSDVPVQVLSYALVEGPTNAVIDSNGVIRWTPGPDRSTNVFTTVVRDDGVPPLSATNIFNVYVTDAPYEPAIQSITVNDGLVTVAWNSLIGRGYQLQFKDDLTSPAWTNHGGIIQGTGGAVIATNLVGSTPQRFYRIVRLP